MINKMTIESRWRNDPNKIYYVIQNPKLDSKTKKIRGLTIKTVPYKVNDWDKEVVNFVRVDNTKDLRFPETLVFDKRSHDATTEVYAERVSNAVKKPDSIDSYAIFEEKDQAHFNKLMRLHRFSETIALLHEAQSQTKKEVAISETDSAEIKELKNNVKTKQIKLTADELIEIFNTVQETNYFDELEKIQENHPDLAMM